MSAQMLGFGNGTCLYSCLLGCVDMVLAKRFGEALDYLGEMDMRI